MTIDAELGEVLQDNEAQLTEQIADALSEKIRRDHKLGQPLALRDAHPRAHGCVEAEFRIEDKLPVHLAQGVFVPGKRYRAWIRFSNGSPDTKKHDAKGDVRGMAIKLLDVPGDKLLAEEREAPTQDFVLMSHPVFFIDDAASYLTFSRRLASTNRLVKLAALLALGLKGALIAKRATSLKIASPLEIRYWSAVPYRLGDPPHKQAIKFSARPCLPPSSKIPPDPSPIFLRETMIKQLQQGEAQFDFLVQPRTSPAMDVERSMLEWNEAAAPFFKVATITIPRQEFATDERDQFGENLSFSPWHSLPQHRPLGAVNRIRRVAYQTISKLRHELNGAPYREPN